MSETSKTTPSDLGDATTFSALSGGVVAELSAVTAKAQLLGRLENYAKSRNPMGYYGPGDSFIDQGAVAAISDLLALIESQRATIERQRVALIEADATLTSEDACNIEPIVGSHNPHENAAGLVRRALSRSSSEVKNDER